MSRPMSQPSAAYIFGTAVAGLLCLVFAGLQWAASDLQPFLVLLVMSLLVSPLKVTLPGIASSLSVNYIFILAAISQLHLLPALVITATATVVQCVWRPRVKPTAVHLIFNAASVTVAATAAWLVCHTGWLSHLESSIPILFFAASSAYFLVNTASVAGVIALTGGKSVIQVWRENFLWTAPQYLVGATVAAMFRVLSDHVGWQWAVIVLPSMYVIYGSYRVYLGRVEAERNHATEISQLHLRTLEALAVAIEAKDETTHDHLRRVQVYATEVAREMAVSEPEIEALRAAALLHDIGKLAVPEYILSKPGRLTPEEFERIKIHPVVGAEILERVRFPYPVAPIVAAHHEKWDGTGYPHGLRAEQIPIGARILTAVDCLDALASERQYRRALPLDEAMNMISSQAGTSFDPRVVEILKRRYRDLERMAREAPLPETKLSVHTTVERGDAPDAGFVKVAESAAPPPNGAPGFITFIAAARQEFQNLHELTNSLGTSLSLEGTLSLLAAHMKNIVPHDAIAVYVVEGKELVPHYTAGIDAELFQSIRIPVGQGLSGWVAETRKSIINGNPSVEPGDPRKFSVLASALAVPLVGTEGIIGVLTLYHKAKDAFTRDHHRLLTAITSKASLTIENALKFREARQGAVTDALTGLANTRSLFVHLESEIARAERSGETLTILVLDLDGFKEVNDRFGHLTGNKVLRQVGRHLQGVCRPYDYVARMGGDEFVLVLAGITDGALVRKREELDKLVRAAGADCTGETVLSASIGEASYPSEGTNAEELLAEADRKMYAMKHSRRNRGRVVPVLGDTKVMAMSPLATTRIH